MTHLVVADRPVDGREPTQPIQQFIAEIETLHDSEISGKALVACVEERLSKLVWQPNLLWPDEREPWPDHYRSHLVAVAPSRRFSVVALVWLPGQITPIHDHVSWCVVSVLEGLEAETRYHLRQSEEGNRWLAPVDEVPVTRGMTSALVPPEENIHLVRNAGDQLAISIHVYGADIGVMGSSINQTFDELSIRADMGGEPVSWRLCRDLEAGK
jgi:predicted metal-dependent enzyme (double-stranded beta helix superfamily)